jgi:protein-tyrosine phosphatase
MLWFHLPIVDVSTPDKRFEREWDIAGEELGSILRRGLDVLVHCRGGLGRAGTIAARLLVELGMDPTKAGNRKSARGTTGRDSYWRGTKLIVRRVDGLV